jgi:subtilisin family serine protease
MTKLNAAFGLFAIAILSGCVKEIQPASSPTINELSAISQANTNADGSQQEYVPGELLIKFKSGVTEASKANVLEKITGKVKQHILTKAMETVGDKEGLFLVNTPIGVYNAINNAKAFQEVEYAEPNFIYTHETVTANDPLLGDLWGMGTNYGSNASAAWNSGLSNSTGSKSVAVGIIDEGADYQHVDLSANFWTNSAEVNGLPGKDDDGDGYVDDIHGWNFVDNNNNTYDASQDDHGTHVAGTIGAVGNNSIGVVGVNWNVTLISAKFLGANGGTTANAVQAVDYITAVKKAHPELHLVATNNSWGGGSYSSALYDAITRAGQADILFVAAAGNGNQAGIGINIDKKASYPASYNNTNLIAVAAISSTGSLASWSNYGVTSVDLGAPGVSIKSTLPNDTYGTYSGTSMATPHVTGSCALYAAVYPTATSAQIKNAILSSAIPTSSLKGKTVTGGRLDVNAALKK